MRRITLLTVLALVLTAFVAIPAMAATTFAWSGEITSAFQTDFATAYEAVSTANVTLGVTINDNLSFTGLIITTANAAAGATGALTNTNGAFDATVQLGKILSLPVGEAVTIGNFAPGATTYGVSTIDYEALFGAGMTAGKVSIQSVTTVSGINIQLALDPGSLIGAGATPQYLADVYGALGPLSFSLGYGSNKIQGLDVNFGQKMGDLGFAVDVEEMYNTGASAWGIGFGGKVTYTTLLTFAFGTTYTSTGLGSTGINVNLAPAANYGVDLYADLTGTFAVNYVDASVWTKLDASTFRLGYTYTPLSTVTGFWLGTNWGGENAGGGLYFVYDLSF
jgi:hypothetical protein